MSGRLLTAREVAGMMSVCPETILRWAPRGELPAFRLPGGAIRFREAEIKTWLSERATIKRGEVAHPAGRRPSGTVTAVAHPEEV